MNTHYTYFIILGASLVGPLGLSFDKKVAFYKNWKYLFPAMLLPALFYIVWDIFFTSKGIWSFNEEYISGIKIINLPLEEVLFFFIVPYCCVFIYECIHVYFPQVNNKRVGDIVLKLLAVVLLIVGIIFYDKWYTSCTFILNAVFITAIYLTRKHFNMFDATLFLVAYLVMLIPFLIVNGFLTSIPVVIYNNAENVGIRISTIPLEDTFYGMLLILMNIVIYEKLKSNHNGIWKSS
ncbi:lycopene cyclase domain-containing protein [Ferruginibacter lapsinanis]|uniref:lycopene cyclase domain-containing protein n=1 Tax=Ferruginibacter lapsinanis TaxID=563172 RepID=UPI001E51A9E5|nr:lycopene cyclase domain-containing protein [Ferruginibacter lapsinanis]UEG50539.1 lycopene cyclase domain-containing protein [Ferruginibacter lapsinanis]